MQFDHREIREYLKESEFENLFTQAHGFTDEELDFIISYNIKYRTGLGN